MSRTESPLPVATLVAIATLLSLPAPSRCEQRVLKPLATDDLRDWFVENGNDGGVADEANPNWSLREGMLTCRGDRFGFLRYKHRLADFDASFEFQLSTEANSGVGFWTRPYDGTLSSRPSVAGYELQLLGPSIEADSPQHAFLSLYGHRSPQRRVTAQSDHWHHLSLRCTRTCVRVRFDGRDVLDFDVSEDPELRDRPRKGYFCFQSHSGVVSFRKLVIVADDRSVAHSGGDGPVGTNAIESPTPR